MNESLLQSYRHCRRLVRHATSNLPWAFAMLPRDKRDAMCALYAFARHTDDLGDNGLPRSSRKSSLDDWRRALHRAFNNEFDDPIWPAVADTAVRFDIPRDYLFAIIDGVAMDLDPPHYETFEYLRKYCYHVASAVGLACIHIWGFNDRQAFRLADDCGVAFQMTNILRDLYDDARRGRVYLPREDMRRFGYRPQDLTRGLFDEQFRSLMRFEIKRTEEWYEKAAPLTEILHADARLTFRLMFETYRMILGEIRRRDGDVFSSPVRVSRVQKVSLAATAILANLRGSRNAASAFAEGPRRDGNNSTPGHQIPPI